MEPNLKQQQPWTMLPLLFIAHTLAQLGTVSFRCSSHKTGLSFSANYLVLLYTRHSSNVCAIVSGPVQRGCAAFSSRPVLSTQKKYAQKLCRLTDLTQKNRKKMGNGYSVQHSSVFLSPPTNTNEKKKLCKKTVDRCSAKKEGTHTMRRSLRPFEFDSGHAASVARPGIACHRHRVESL